MSRFDDCLPLILRYEGGKVDDLDDRGGRTNQGVTQKVYSVWLASKARPDADVFDIAPADVSAIYRQNYWERARCGELPAPVDFAVFDGAVNSGPSQAAKWLQRAAGVKDDGLIGPMTLAAVKSLDPLMVAAGVCDQREAFFQMLAKRPGQAKFLKGWLRRVTDVRARCVLS